jgi:AraC-like DNA-binding protein
LPRDGFSDRDKRCPFRASHQGRLAGNDRSVRVSSEGEADVLPQVRAVALTNYVEVARSVGLDPHAMLRRAGINLRSLADPEQLIPAAPVADLFEDSARESGCEQFGLLLAETRSLASIGAVGLLLKHQHSAREVIEAIVEYQGLMAEALDYSIEQVGDTIILRTGLVAGLAGPQASEFTMAMFCRTVGGVVSWRPESAHFIHQAPRSLDVHARIFQCPLVFGSEFNGFVTSAEALDTPNPAAQPIMAEHARRYLDMLAPDSVDGSTVARVCRSLGALLPAGATLERVAENLGLHPRALQRLLEQEGETFASLLNQVRRDLASRHLSDSARSITSVAQMLGYATSSSFTRWFGREFGMSPAAWREAERSAPGEGQQ